MAASTGKGKRFGKNLFVTDTPGFCDTRMTRSDVTKAIVKSIALISPGPHAIVLVLAIARFTTEDQNVVQMFFELFGEKMYKHMIVVFTGRDNIERDGMSIQNYVLDEYKMFEDLLKKCDQRYLAFDNTPELPSTKRDNDAEQLILLVEHVISKNKGQCYSSEIFIEIEMQFQQRIKKLEDDRNKDIEDLKENIRDVTETVKQIEKINARYHKALKNARSMFRSEVENEDKVVIKNLTTGLYRIVLGLWNAAKKPFTFLGSIFGIK